MKSKRLAATSSTALAEILGVSGSSTPISLPESGFSTLNPSGSSTPAAAPIPDTMQELTTSTKSVADYFKDKLAQRSRSGSASTEQTNRPPLTTDEELEAPRSGLGMKRPMFESTVPLSQGNGALVNAAPLLAFTLPSSSTPATLDEGATSGLPSDVTDGSGTVEPKKRKKKAKGDCEVKDSTSSSRGSDEQPMEKRKKDKKDSKKKNSDS